MSVIGFMKNTRGFYDKLEPIKAKFQSLIYSSSVKFNCLYAFKKQRKAGASYLLSIGIPLYYFLSWTVTYTNFSLYILFMICKRSL